MTVQKQILISLATFVAMMFGPAASAQTDILEINDQIRHAREKIQESRIRNAKNIRRNLRRNHHYRYVIDYQTETDSLRAVNDEYLTRAQEIVRKKDIWAMPAHNPMVFILYSKYSELNSLGNLYNMNQRRIDRYEYHVEQSKGYPQSVKNYCDSIMHAEIDYYQHIIDSLLNKKMQLIK